MAEYKNNSISEREKKETKEAGPKPKKVIQDGIGEKRPTLLDKIRQSFTGNEDQSIGEYLLLDVAIPMLKDMILSGVTGALSMKFYGDSRRATGARTNYSASSHNRTTSYSTRTEDKVRSTNPSEIPLRSRRDAMAVIDALDWNIKEYGRATVADFMEAIGRTPDFTDNDRGWTDVSNAYPSQDNYGNYYVNLPRPRVV